MTQAPPAKDMQHDPASDNARLESRIAMLEDNMVRLNSFNETVVTALSQMLTHVKNFEPTAQAAMRTELKFENYRSMQTLARASKIFPKTRTVVFVSKGYFGDNVKYAFLAFCDYARGKNIDVRFLTDDPAQKALLDNAGLPCLFADPDGWTLADVKILLGAKVVVLGNNFHPYVMQSPKAFGMLQGAKTIQLWHGIPVKDIGLRHLVRTDNLLLDELIASAGRYDVLVAPGAAARGEWAQLFAFRDFAPLGYPRTDVFFRDITARDRINVDTETLALFETAKREMRPAILYAPTFRDDKACGWFIKAKIEALAEHARLRGYAFAVNFHPYEQSLVPQFRPHFPGIHFVAPDTDIYPVVKYTDVLISDYSSLAFDYLLLDRPLIFYRHDHDYYMNHARGLIEGRERLTPGPVIAGMDDLIRAVDAATVFALAPEGDPFRAARHDLRGKLFDHLDGNAGQRVCDLIVKQMEAD